MRTLVGVLMITAVLASALLQVQTAGPPGECRALDGLSELAERVGGRPLLLGEWHGTQEAPRVAGQIACLFLESGTPIVLALEIPSDEQLLIDRYLATDRDEAARYAMLTRSKFWRREAQDGRSSAAWFALLDLAGEWREAGHPVSVRAVDRNLEELERPDPPSRDQAMATHILQLVSEGRQVVFLGGNIHARRTQAHLGGRTRESIGYILEDETFVSVVLVPDGGDSWVCSGTSLEDLTCGARAAPERRALSGDPRVLGQRELEACDCLNHWRDAYHEFVYLARVSASEPAIESVRED